MNGSNNSSPHQNLLFHDVLHILLEDCEKNDESAIISWCPKGNSFKVHNKDVFTNNILPRYFRQSKYKSFARPLNIWGFLCVTKGSDKGHYYHRHFLRGQREISCMMKRVSNKSAQGENVSSSLWDWPSPSSAAAMLLDDASTGGTTTSTKSVPRLDAEVYAAVAVAVDDNDFQHQQSSLLMPTLTIHRSKDELVRKLLNPAPYRDQWCAQPPCLEGSIARENRVTTVLSLLPHMEDKSTAAAICSIEEPMEDWLSCFEKGFEDAPCPHPKEWTHGDPSHARSKHCYHYDCSAKSGSSWDVLEPRPLRMNTKDYVW